MVKIYLHVLLQLISDKYLVELLVLQYYVSGHHQIKYTHFMDSLHMSHVAANYFPLLVTMIRFSLKGYLLVLVSDRESLKCLKSSYFLEGSLHTISSTYSSWAQQTSLLSRLHPAKARISEQYTITATYYAKSVYRRRGPLRFGKWQKFRRRQPLLDDDIHCLLIISG